jgi:hypothetical protein
MPDGRRIVYLKGAPGNGVLVMRAWDGTGGEDALYDAANVAGVSIGSRGKYLAVPRGTIASGSRDIWIAPLDSPQALRPLLATPEVEDAPILSPDATLLAYESGEPGRVRLHVRPLGRPGAAVLVTGDRLGAYPVWSPDGRELFFRTESQLFVAAIATTPELAVTRTDTLFAVDQYDRGFDVLPGGREFVFVKAVRPPSRGFLGIVNWTDELTRRFEGPR